MNKKFLCPWNCGWGFEYNDESISGINEASRKVEMHMAEQGHKLNSPKREVQDRWICDKCGFLINNTDWESWRRADKEVNGHIYKHQIEAAPTKAVESWDAEDAISEAVAIVSEHWQGKYRCGCFRCRKKEK